MEISATTRLVALLGDPVGHSLSPRMQNAAFRAADVDGVYVALRCAAGRVPDLMHALSEAGGAGNITVPHKSVAAECLDVATDAVRVTGACNTFWRSDGHLHGDNTDVEGFRAAAGTLVGTLAGIRALVLGAGGAARACIAALLEARADAVHLVNRTPERARRVRNRMDPEGRHVSVMEERDRLGREAYDLVVNATPLGIRPDDPLPLRFETVGRAGAALDLVYAPGGATPWVTAARERGIPAADGTEMLLGQGAAAFRRWWDREPPVEAMRRALASAS